LEARSAFCIGRTPPAKTLPTRGFSILRYLQYFSAKFGKRLLKSKSVDIDFGKTCVRFLQKKKETHNFFHDDHRTTYNTSDTHNFTSTQPIPTSKYIPDSSAPMLHIKVSPK
jgi:hypothetical protein